MESLPQGLVIIIGTHIMTSPLTGGILISPADDLGSLIHEKLLKEKKKSLELCLTHLENGRRRYQSVTSVQELTVNTVGGEDGEGAEMPLPPELIVLVPNI